MAGEEGTAASDRRSGPRYLVIYPQRTNTSRGFVVLGLFLMSAPVWAWLASHTDLQGWPTPAEIAVGGLFTLCASVGPALGLHGLFRRVAFDVHPEGLLTITWFEWPRPRRTRTLPVRDVKQVVVEGNDTVRIVLILPHEVLPLTGSSTSDGLSDKVAALSRFFGHDEAVVVVDEARPFTPVPSRPGAPSAESERAWIECALTGPNATARGAAADALLAVPDWGAVMVLLNASDLGVRERAWRAAAVLCETDVDGVMLAHIRNDDLVRILGVLAESGGPSVLPQLRSLAGRGWFGRSAVAHAAHVAIEKIECRPAAPVGSVSVAESDDGALSVVRSEPPASSGDPRVLDR